MDHMCQYGNCDSTDTPIILSNKVRGSRDRFCCTLHAVLHVLHYDSANCTAEYADAVQNELNVAHRRLQSQKRKTEMTYAIVQNGHAVFGIGDTLEAAYRDAHEWTDDLPDLTDIPGTSNTDGELFWALITPALATQVQARGGDVAWGELSDGTLCTLSEETVALAGHYR